jgi:hypothetical protein
MLCSLSDNLVFDNFQIMKKIVAAAEFFHFSAFLRSIFFNCHYYNLFCDRYDKQ